MTEMTSFSIEEFMKPIVSTTLLLNETPGEFLENDCKTWYSEGTKSEEYFAYAELPNRNS